MVSFRLREQFNGGFIGMATALAIVMSGLASLASADCYTPNSLPRGSDNYKPAEAVSNVDGYQMCCATFRDPPDVPRADGLCTGPEGQIWRESCTDRSWRSPNCIKLCVNGTGTICLVHVPKYLC